MSKLKQCVMVVMVGMVGLVQGDKGSGSRVHGKVIEHKVISSPSLGKPAHFEAPGGRRFTITTDGKIAGISNPKITLKEAKETSQKAADALEKSKQAREAANKEVAVKKTPPTRPEPPKQSKPELKKPDTNPDSNSSGKSTQKTTSVTTTERRDSAISTTSSSSTEGKKLEKQHKPGVFTSALKTIGDFFTKKEQPRENWLEGVKVSESNSKKAIKDMPNETIDDVKILTAKVLSDAVKQNPLEGRGNIAKAQLKIDDFIQQMESSKNPDQAILDQAIIARYELERQSNSLKNGMGLLEPIPATFVKNEKPLSLKEATELTLLISRQGSVGAIPPRMLDILVQRLDTVLRVKRLVDQFEVISGKIKKEQGRQMPDVVGIDQVKQAVSINGAKSLAKVVGDNIGDQLLGARTAGIEGRQEALQHELGYALKYAQKIIDEKRVIDADQLGISLNKVYKIAPEQVRPFLEKNRKAFEDMNKEVFERIQKDIEQKTQKITELENLVNTKSGDEKESYQRQWQKAIEEKNTIIEKRQNKLSDFQTTLSTLPEQTLIPTIAPQVESSAPIKKTPPPVAPKPKLTSSASQQANTNTKPAPIKPKPTLSAEKLESLKNPRTSSISLKIDGSASQV